MLKLVSGSEGGKKTREKKKKGRTSEGMNMGRTDGRNPTEEVAKQVAKEMPGKTSRNCYSGGAKHSTRRGPKKQQQRTGAKS